MNYDCENPDSTFSFRNYKLVCFFKSLIFLKQCLWNVFTIWWSRVRVSDMVCKTTFNNISYLSWRSVLLVEEIGVLGINHRPVASHWKTLSHNVVSWCFRQSILVRTDKSKYREKILPFVVSTGGKFQLEIVKLEGLRVSNGVSHTKPLRNFLVKRTHDPQRGDRAFFVSAFNNWPNKWILANCYWLIFLPQSPT